MPKAGVQRLASWLGNTWSRRVFVPLPRETLPGQQRHRGWQKPIYQLRAAPGLEQRWCLGAEYQHPHAPNGCGSAARRRSESRSWLGGVTFGGDTLGCSRVCSTWRLMDAKYLGSWKKNPQKSSHVLSSQCCFQYEHAFSMLQLLRLVVSLNVRVEFITRWLTRWSNTIYYYFLMV